MSEEYKLTQAEWLTLAAYNLAKLQAKGAVAHLADVEHFTKKIRLALDKYEEKIK